MARYTYLAADLRTNQILAELPLNAVDFKTRLNDIGDLRGSILLTDPAANKVANYLQNATQPGRTALYVDRDGVLVWGGIIWTRRYTASTGVLELKAQDFLSYFSHRYLTASLPQVSGVAYDQLAIIQALINWAQGITGGNIGINVGVETSGVLRQITYNAYERKRIGDALWELSSLDLGFDYAVDVSYVAGVPTKALHLSYPRRGAPAGSTGWLFEHEAAGWYVPVDPTTGLPAGAAAPMVTGNIADYVWPEDATLQGITVYEQGAGSGMTQLLSSYSTSGMIDLGWPLLEAAFDAPDIKIQSHLDARARSDGKAVANPIVLAELNVRAELDPVLGSYTIGDDARFRILDHRFNSGVDAVNNPVGPGIDTFYRIIEIAVRAGFDQPEDVKITIGPLPT